MFGIGELIVIIAVCVVALGWKRLPQIGGTLRKSALGFRKGLAGEEESNPVRDVEPYPDKKIDPSKKD